MPLTGKAVVAIWNDIIPEKRDAFFEWHPREHMNERLGIPGFRRGRRYIALEAGIEFFTLYEADSKEVLTGNSYRQRLNTPTPWSLEVLPGFRNNLRGVCDIISSYGHADGGLLYTLRFEPEPGREESLKRSVAEWTREMVERPRVTGAHFVICDLSTSGTNTSLQRGRTITPPAWIALVEGSSADGLGAAVADLTAGGRLIDYGAKPSIAGGLYRLEYQVSRLTVEELAD